MFKEQCGSHMVEIFYVGFFFCVNDNMDNMHFSSLVNMLHLMNKFLKT